MEMHQHLALSGDRLTREAGVVLCQVNLSRRKVGARSNLLRAGVNEDVSDVHALKKFAFGLALVSEQV